MAIIYIVICTVTHNGDLIASYWVFSIREHLILHVCNFISKVLNLAIETAYVAFFFYNVYL